MKHSQITFFWTGLLLATCTCGITIHSNSEFQLKRLKLKFLCAVRPNKAWTASVRKSHQWQYCSKVNKLSSIMEVESSGSRICSVWSRSFRQSDRPNVPLLSAEQLPWLISSDGFYHDYCRALYTTPTLCILYAVTMYGCQDSMHTGRGREGWSWQAFIFYFSLNSSENGCQTWTYH